MSSNRHHQGQSGSARSRANPTQPQTTRSASALLERLINLNTLFLDQYAREKGVQSSHDETVGTLQSLVVEARHRLSNRQSDQNIFNIFGKYRTVLAVFESELEAMRKLSKQLAKTAREQEDELVEIIRGQNHQQEDN